MNFKLLAVALVIIVVAVGSGVWVLGNSNSEPGKFTINSSGGTFDYLDRLKIKVPEGTFDKDTTITVASYSDQTQDPEIKIVSAYEFDPSGLVFDPPAELSINYNPQNLPEGISEADLGLYVLEDDKWKLLEGSSVNIDTNIVSAPVRHFSKMGCGASSSDSNDQPDDLKDVEEVEDGQATAWYKADIIFGKNSTRDDSDPEKAQTYDSTTYVFGTRVLWKPTTYVKYYQVKFYFHGNPPEDYAWAYDYTEQSKYDHMPFSYKEGIVYHLGTDYDKPHFIGKYELPQQFGGKHGFMLLGFKEKIYDVQVDEGLNVDALLAEIDNFSHAYYDGWEIWVRGIT